MNNLKNVTKIIVTGKKPKKEKIKKPIEFVWFVNSKGERICAISTPSDYYNIEATLRNNGFDIFYCYNYNRAVGFLYLGHYNDGVIE